MILTMGVPDETPVVPGMDDILPDNDCIEADRTHWIARTSIFGHQRTG